MRHPNTWLVTLSSFTACLADLLQQLHGLDEQIEHYERQLDRLALLAGLSPNDSTYRFPLRRGDLV